MTTKDREITAMGLFRKNLDFLVQHKEKTLTSRLESLRREIDRALENMKAGYRVDSSGIVGQNGDAIDHLCVTLNELYDARIQFDAAQKADAEKGGAK